LVAALWPARAEARRAYGRALAQRNALLARCRSGESSPGSLDSWDTELACAGAELIAARAAAVERLREPFTDAAADLGLVGMAEVEYRPRAEAGEIATELRVRREADVARGFTGYGPHLDEVRIAVGGRAVRHYGSQGEQRVTLLALLFAEREALLEERRSPPLMLLDDVTSELDGERRARLCERLASGGGQTLITATEPDHLPGERDRVEVPLRGGAVISVAGEGRAA
jgi:DNA replication and repair protein RecF